ncbi:hypothetical protein MUA02_00210, partial [Enterobacteriaceae bacterium H20N1]|nr:hypothetical protein [Dryocola boscaweniae]MCT4717506.1 hypothetical protein [Dryocola boscaweniae]
AGNSLWMQRDTAGNASAEVVNTSGNIETQNGDITIRTGHLLNEAEGLTISQYEREYPDAIPGLSEGLHGWYYGMQTPDFEVDIEEWKHNGDNIVWKSEEECTGSGAIGSGGCRDIYYYRLKGEDTRRYLLGESVVSVSATGGAARIAAGRDIAINAGTLDNRASHILAERNVTLKGDTLNNLSAEGGRQAIYVNAEYRCEWFYNDCDSSRWQPLTKLNENTWAWANSRKFGVVPYILGERTTEFVADGGVYRSVIQAGGNVTASFTSDISNTTTTANAGGISNTISSPTLNTLSSQTIGNSQQGLDLASADATAVNSPEWQDNLADAVA